MSHRTRTKKSLEVSQGKRVTLTQEAAEKIKQALEEFSASGVRVQAKQNKKGALSFSLDLEEAASSDDLVLDEKGIKLFLDPSSTQHIQGIEIQYVKTEKGPGFAIVNTTYGCGPG
ncbi:MAG: HesB/IscA family protein [Candidatus Binatia bacterium]